MEARLPRETRKPFRMANPADSRLISAHNVRQSPVRANGRRGKPRLYGRIYVVSLNHNYGVDVIGHYHVSVDDHVRVVARNGLHFDFSNESRFGKHYLSVDRVA